MDVIPIAQLIVLSIHIETLQQNIRELPDMKDSFQKTGNFLKTMNLTILMDKFTKVTKGRLDCVESNLELTKDIEIITDYLSFLTMCDVLEKQITGKSIENLCDTIKLLGTDTNRSIELLPYPSVTYAEFVEQFYFLFGESIQDKDYFIGFIVQEYAKIWQDWKVY